MSEEVTEGNMRGLNAVHIDTCIQFRIIFQSNDSYSISSLFLELRSLALLSLLPLLLLLTLRRYEAEDGRFSQSRNHRRSGDRSCGLCDEYPELRVLLTLAPQGASRLRLVAEVESS